MAARTGREPRHVHATPRRRGAAPGGGILRILAAADLHGALETYEWLLSLAARYRPGAVVLAGDLLGWPPDDAPIEVAQGREAERILDVMDRMPCPVLYVMGNDDLIELPCRSGKILSVHGRRHDIGAFNFVGYQYSLPFMMGCFEKPEEEIAADLRGLAAQVDDRTVLVTHSPAFGILDLGILDNHAGSRSILDLVASRRPRAHVHGHIHSSVGREGRHWNVATYGRQRAVLIDLDTLEDEIIESHRPEVPGEEA